MCRIQSYLFFALCISFNTVTEHYWAIIPTIPDKRKKRFKHFYICGMVQNSAQSIHTLTHFIAIMYFIQILLHSDIFSVHFCSLLRVLNAGENWKLTQFPSKDVELKRQFRRSLWLWARHWWWLWPIAAAADWWLGLTHHHVLLYRRCLGHQ